MKPPAPGARQPARGALGTHLPKGDRQRSPFISPTLSERTGVSLSKSSHPSPVLTLDGFIWGSVVTLSPRGCQAVERLTTSDCYGPLGVCQAVQVMSISHLLPLQGVWGMSKVTELVVAGGRGTEALYVHLTLDPNSQPVCFPKAMLIPKNS